MRRGEFLQQVHQFFGDNSITDEQAQNLRNLLGLDYQMGMEETITYLQGLQQSEE